MTANTSGPSVPEVQFEYSLSKRDLVKSIHRKCYHWKAILGFYFVIAFVPHAMFGFIETWLMKQDESDMPGIYDKVMLVWHSVFLTWLIVMTISMPILIWLYTRLVSKHRFGVNGFSQSTIKVSPVSYLIQSSVDHQPIQFEVKAPVKLEMDNDSCCIKIAGVKNMNLDRLFIKEDDWQKLREYTKICTHWHSDSDGTKLP